MDIQKIAECLRPVSDTPLSDARLLSENCSNINEAVARRLAHEPVSKIIGCRGFWKRDFKTSVDVLDPRPDSEIIIESVLKAFPDRSAPYHILDIGTGSGCLLASLLGEYPNATGVGVDKSDKALQIATENCEGLSAKLYQRDFMQSGCYQDLGQFHIIISNPPYIPTNDIQTLSPDVKEYDPIIALDGGADGLNAYRAIIPVLSSLLMQGGKVFFEIGQGQENDVALLLKQNGFLTTHAEKDYGHIVRVIWA